MNQTASSDSDSWPLKTKFLTNATSMGEQKLALRNILLPLSYL